MKICQIKQLTTVSTKIVGNITTTADVNSEHGELTTTQPEVMDQAARTSKGNNIPPTDTILA